MRSSTHERDRRQDWAWTVFVAALMCAVLGAAVYFLVTGTGDRDHRARVGAWIAAVGSVALAGQTLWTTRNGFVYHGRLVTYQKSEEPALYRCWVAIQWSGVAALALIAAQVLLPR
ncbi:MAG TPA: hypothetical protein VMR86_07005 [Myxococcota bacterium]|nr:hypothetical protein [Myxococcota bacterium]